MSLDPSHAVVERSLREYVHAYLPEVPSSPPGAPIDRSLRGWLLRFALPRVLAAIGVVIGVVLLTGVLHLIFAANTVCELRPHVQPFGPVIQVEVCYPKGLISSRGS
ncbi:MAG: hypothetical protein Q7T33_10010 [Dehalococcoidia bacterium]|nr:hypothetical protein [Dehalococcoidia bacterium]